MTPMCVCVCVQEPEGAALKDHNRPSGDWV